MLKSCALNGEVAVEQATTYVEAYKKFIAKMSQQLREKSAEKKRSDEIVRISLEIIKQEGSQEMKEKAAAAIRSLMPVEDYVAKEGPWPQHTLLEALNSRYEESNKRWNQIITFDVATVDALQTVLLNLEERAQNPEPERSKWEGEDGAKKELTKEQMMRMSERVDVLAEQEREEGKAVNPSRQKRLSDEEELKLKASKEVNEEGFRAMKVPQMSLSTVEEEEAVLVEKLGNEENSEKMERVEKVEMPEKVEKERKRRTRGSRVDSVGRKDSKNSLPYDSDLDSESSEVHNTETILVCVFLWICCFVTICFESFL